MIINTTFREFSNHEFLMLREIYKTYEGRAYAKGRTDFLISREQSIIDICEENNVYYSVHTDLSMHTRRYVFELSDQQYTLLQLKYSERVTYEPKEQLTINYTNPLTQMVPTTQYRIYLIDL